MENECLTDLLEVYSRTPNRNVRPPVVNDILPPGLHLLVGPSAAGKTILALCLTDAVLNGDKFLGHPTREGDVYLILLDRGREQNSSRLDANIRANSKRMPTVMRTRMARHTQAPKQRSRSWSAA